VATVPATLSFPAPGAADTVDVLNDIADHVGNCYEPSCMSHCGCARLCRERARAVGDPARLGAGTVRLLPGVRSLDRAAELARGAPATFEEAAAARQLARAVRVAGRVAPIQLDVRRRRGA
jgi:hypothetical protein